MVYTLRTLAPVNGNLKATAGTIACGNAREATFQPKLDANSGYEIVLKPVSSAAGTCNRGNYAGMVTDGGAYTMARPAGVGSNNWWIARRNYNGATGAAGSTADRYSVDLRG